MAVYPAKPDIRPNPSVYHNQVWTSILSPNIPDDTIPERREEIDIEFPDVLVYTQDDRVSSHCD